MRYRDDKRGPKILFLLLIIPIIYLAFFNFDISAALDAILAGQVDFFRTLFK